MKALQDLFSTDYGLMSIGGIVFITIGMFVAYGAAKKKMAEDAKNAGE